MLAAGHEAYLINASGLIGLLAFSVLGLYSSEFCFSELCLPGEVRLYLGHLVSIAIPVKYNPEAIEKQIIADFKKLEAEQEN